MRPTATSKVLLLGHLLAGHIVLAVCKKRIHSSQRNAMSGHAVESRSRSIQATDPDIRRLQGTVETLLTYGVENAYTWCELLIPQTPPPLPTLRETREPGIRLKLNMLDWKR